MKLLGAKVHRSLLMLLMSMVVDQRLFSFPLHFYPGHMKFIFMTFPSSMKLSLVDRALLRGSIWHDSVQRRRLLRPYLVTEIGRALISGNGINWITTCAIIIDVNTNLQGGGHIDTTVQISLHNLNVQRRTHFAVQAGQGKWFVRWMVVLFK